MAGVIHADLEAFLIGNLSTSLTARTETFTASVKVSNRVPSEQPGDLWPTSKRLVVIRDDGGNALGDVRAIARLGIRVWGADAAETSDLANLVSALIGSTEGAGPIRRSEANRPYDVTEASARPCQYFTAELVVRGVGL